MEMYKGYGEQRQFGPEMARDLVRGFEAERPARRRRNLAAQVLASWLMAVGAHL